MPQHHLKPQILPMELGNIKRLRKKLKQSEKNYQNIGKNCTIYRNGSAIIPYWKVPKGTQQGTPIRIENQQIGALK